VSELKACQRTTNMGERKETVVTHRQARVSESAVLDIGGEIGALIIYADQDMVGEEIEICRSGDLSSKAHNVVRARRAPTGLLYAAVFPTLYGDRYDVLGADGIPIRQVGVSGGRVTEVDCRRALL
jgi:hypothetical protein